MKRWIAKKQSDLKQVIHWLYEDCEVTKPLEITVQEFKENRSAKQHRLLWKWNTEIGIHMGLSKEEVHYMLKANYAVPIFIRDDEGYAEMVASVKDVRRQGMDNQADQLKRWIVEHTSTTDFNVSQMTEYLRDVEAFAVEHGANITFPEELYYEAVVK